MTAPLRAYLACAALCGAFASFAFDAHSKETALDAAPLTGVKVRLDGMIKEWPALVPLSETLQGSAGKDPSAMGLVGYDSDNVYVALRVTDANLVRTAAAGKNEDHGSLRLSFPRAGGGYKHYTVDLYPGVPGKSAGAVKLGGALLSAAKLIEAPSADGFSLEASIPWSAFAEAKRVRSGLKGALLYYDADSAGKLSACVGTSKKTEASLPALTTEAEYSLNHGLIFDRNLNPRPAREVFGNVVGDAMLERIAVYDRYLTVTGWNYRAGKEFFFQDLAISKGADLLQLELADFDGDGKDEVLLVRRVGSADAARDYAEVWRFDAPDAPPRAILQHEVGIVEGKARILNDVSVVKVQGTAQLQVAQGEVDDVDPNTFSALPAGGDTLPVLLPWQAIKSRRYALRGSSFEQVEEKAGNAKLKPPQRGSKLYSGPRPAPSSSSGSARSADDPLPADQPPPPPRPPTAEELLDQVYGLYRSDRKATKAKPRFDFVTNVAADETAERVLVHGSDLVVFGRKFKEGKSYVYTGIGVKSPADILDVTARDVTGDGRADIVVRALVQAQASKSMGGKVVARHALFIYRVTEHGITRVFAAETGRSLEDKTILGHVRFIPAGQGLHIELMPGRALGWTQQTYPFPEDKTPYAGLEPLALPWSQSTPRRYSYQGSEFKQQ